jgi:hypothetical protein
VAAGAAGGGATMRTVLSRRARLLRRLHSSIGVFELACLGYLWVCAVTRRRDAPLKIALGVLAGEGTALLLARGCPLGAYQRRAGDDAAMFELWFGPRIAPFAVPGFTMIAAAGVVALVKRRPRCPLEPAPGPREGSRGC